MLYLTKRLTHHEYDQLVALIEGSARDEAFKLQSKRFLDRVKAMHAETIESFVDEEPFSLFAVRNRTGSAPRHSRSQKDSANVDWMASSPRWLGIVTENYRGLHRQPWYRHARQTRTLLRSETARGDRPARRYRCWFGSTGELSDSPNRFHIDTARGHISWSFDDWAEPISNGARKVLLGTTVGGQSILGWTNIAPCATRLKAFLAVLEKIAVSFDSSEVVPTTLPLGHWPVA